MGSATESALITKSPSGKGNPMAGKSAWSPAAMPMPASTPTADAANATAVASASVAAVTCRRAAPSARSRAFSRVRWATTIAKVLWMEKVATSRAMPEKTRRRVVKRSRNVPATMSRLSAEAALPVMASTPVGSTGVSRSTSCCWLMPGPARTAMEEASPGLGVRYFSASARVSPA